jgi:hypothetical protein
MKVKTYTRIEVGPESGKWVKLSRKFICAAAFYAVNDCFKKPEKKASV